MEYFLHLKFTIVYIFSFTICMLCSITKNVSSFCFNFLSFSNSRLIVFCPGFFAAKQKVRDWTKKHFIYFAVLIKKWMKIKLILRMELGFHYRLALISFFLVMFLVWNRKLRDGFRKRVPCLCFSVCQYFIVLLYSRWD